MLSLEVLCDAWGTGGWCRANGRLRATGQDPAGGTVTVSGSLGDPAGTPVQCSGSGTCTATVPLPEGRGTAQVTATSQYGQAQGSQAWKYDPTPPQMTYGLNPASPDGQNGWYVTAPVVTVQGTDATSGIAALRVSPDGGATWHASPWTIPDGQYTLLVQAVDGAGNITQAQVPVKVDTTAPQVQYHIPPATGQDGWHVAAVTVTVSGQDATSGVALAQVSVNGGPWQDGGVTLAADGVYSLQFRAVDAAGNQAQAGPVEVKVDVTPPRLTWGSGWDGALSCAPALTGRVEDGAGSGVAGAAISWDGGRTWQALPLTPTATGGGPTAWLWQVQPDLRGWTDGTYEVQVKVWDRAGLQATYRKTFTVAQPRPHIVVRPLGTGARWTFWDLLTFEVQTTCLPIHRMRIVVEGPERNRTVTWDTSTWEAPLADGRRPVVYSVTWRWDTAWDNGRFAPPGEYPVRFEAWDAWGRKYMEFGTLVVPVMTGPTPTPAPLPSLTATPTARPTPTVAGSGLPTADRRLPTAIPPTPLATPTPGPTPTWADWATATPLPTATPVPRHTGLVGQAPTWAKTVAVGTLFTGVFLAWLALAREVAKRRWTTARRVGPGELKRLVPPWLRRPRRKPKPSHDHVSDVAERAAKEQEEMALLFAETGERIVDVEERARKEQEEMALHFVEKEKQVKETRRQTHPQLWRISDQPSSSRLLSDSPSSYLSALPLDIQEEVTMIRKCVLWFSIRKSIRK